MRIHGSQWRNWAVCTVVASMTAGGGVLVASPTQDDKVQSLRQVAPLEPPSFDPAEVAGLPAGSRAEALTWERVYTLALVRSRAKGQPGGSQSRLAESFDPKALAEQAAKQHVADFDRFKADFFASGGGAGDADRAFHDPSGPMFDLLRRNQAIENAQKQIHALSQLKSVFQELIKGEASGLTDNDLDHDEEALQQARHRYLEECRIYRDRLDRLKVELGLSPHAAVVLDRSSLAPFRAVFAEADEWQRRPDRKMEELPQIVGKLPSLEAACGFHCGGASRRERRGPGPKPARRDAPRRGANGAQKSPQRPSR